MPVTLSKQTARRYVLGRQGLWPGRRWQALAGTEQALRTCECVQIDTISAVARSHDLHLSSRVEGYDPAMLDRLMYTDRIFFDFGNILMVYPGDEMPYWRAVMRRHRDRVNAEMDERLPVIEHVRSEIAARGPLASRDFAGRERVPGGFNTVKDSAIALNLLWLTGEIATHSRRGFDRVYDLSHNLPIAAGNGETAGDAEAQSFFGRKAMRELGLATGTEWWRRMRVYLSRSPDLAAAKSMAKMSDEGFLAPFKLEGEKSPRWALMEDLPILDTLAAGGVPDAWRALGPTTEDETSFLAPLDNVIWDRARARDLFDFDYVWEVYKPAKLRRWGYYTLPILWGDKLVARFAPRLNRKTQTLTVEGFWLEQADLAADPGFKAALTAAMHRFCAFHKAQTLDPGDMRTLLGFNFTPTNDLGAQ